MQVVLNPFTGQFQLLNDETVLHVKDPVATYNSLPVSGNAENDCRMVKDTDQMYTWSIAASSGSISDWKQVSMTSVAWANDG